MADLYKTHFDSHQTLSAVFFMYLLADSLYYFPDGTELSKGPVSY